MAESKSGRLPTIPEYYKDHINSKVNLLENPKQPCPFHHETAPSFSFSAERGIWSCFGGCKCFGKDVIELHRKNYNLSTREEAESSLYSMYGIIKPRPKFDKSDFRVEVNEDRIENEMLYQEALLLANNPDRWDELDYFMSKTPIEYTDLKYILEKWKDELL